MITVLIPTRNEEDNIETALDETQKELEKNNEKYEILVIDDASSDKTVEKVKKATEKNSNIRLIQRKPPYGFGYSLREGIEQAKGEACVILMADLSDDPKLIPLMKKAIDNGADMIIGSRFISGAKIENYPAKKMISNRLFNLAIQVGLLSGIADSSNAFKMFRTDLAKKIMLESKGFEISAELTSKFIINKFKIKEIPASWHDREGGEAKFKLGNEAKRYFLLYLKLIKEAHISKKHTKS